MLRKVAIAGGTVELAPGATTGMAVGAEIAQPQPAAIVTAVVGTKLHRGLNDTRASVGRRHRIRSHRRPGLGMCCLVLTQGTGGLVGEACKRLGLLGALTPQPDGLGWRSLCCRASAGPGRVQHDKQPQESQDCQLVEKKVWNHGKTPSLGGETGGFYLILGPMELSAA
jgi:hypothetical protein